MIQLAKQLGGHGKIAILAGNESAPNLRQRVEGVREEAARHPGVQIVGISYDSPAVLKKFSDQAKITFPMLSDPESRTIEAYHIRNEAARGRAEGVPRPGTFILDREGVIRAKLFLEGYRDRHTTDALIDAAKFIR